MVTMVPTVNCLTFQCRPCLWCDVYSVYTFTVQRVPKNYIYIGQFIIYIHCHCSAPMQGYFPIYVK